MDNWLAIVGVIALIVLFVLPFLPIGTRPRCPECRSRKIGVNKTNKGFRTTGFGGGGSGGGEGGGYTAVQTFYDVKYRCNDCQAEWTSTATETT
ncbi:hypothetical protein [Candidatus Leptofilum sp.]|uniref:hypothetical protein n=1 Tax=Candidatus Leptofilum sp. TaxID=3241576 RepID=UPI003B5C5274